jgi:hypothetical protein
LSHQDFVVNDVAEREEVVERSEVVLKRSKVLGLDFSLKTVPERRA